MGGLDTRDQRLAAEVAETLHSVTVVLATLRQTDGYGPHHWGVRALDRLADELVSRWASYAQWPAPETRRRVQEVLDRWRSFDPRRL